MIPARSWREILADARATLEPVAEAHPDLAPDALLALLLDTVAGLVELEQMAGHIVDGLDRRSFCTAARCLARDRRAAQGLRVCTRHPTCPHEPAPMTIGLVTVLVCEECAALPW